ncbi:MAG: site-specific integrase [Thermaerobacter sp.]|nr:site-specific integrase [Thermaerobacter sp.]
MQEILGRYLGYLKAEGKSPKTLKAYGSDAHDFLAHIGRQGLGLSELAARDVRAIEEGSRRATTPPHP